MSPATADPAVDAKVKSGAHARLIAAGIDLFGAKGFDATSTRELAQAAGVNISGIVYHFGGKDGLYIACAEHIGRMVRDRVAGHDESSGTDSRERPIDAPGARDAIAERLSRMVRLIAATPEMETATRFILREHMDPTPAFDVLYDSMMGPLSDEICRLWSLDTGAEPDSEVTRLTILGLIGQLLVFRVAKAAACRRMGWSEIGPREARAIETMILTTLDALIAAHEGSAR